jgi:hypothetical protein
MKKILFMALVILFTFCLFGCSSTVLDLPGKFRITHTRLFSDQTLDGLTIAGPVDGDLNWRASLNKSDAKAGQVDLNLIMQLAELMATKNVR